MMGTTKAGFSAQTTINRKDFGVLWSKTLDTGALVAGDEVDILVEVEANKIK
jgi:polyisoprenoid-binding protein YceI